MQTFAPRIVLVATDLSANAQPAFEAAASLARTYGAVLHLVHVYQQSDDTLTGGLPLLPTEMLSNHVAVLETQLDALAAPLVTLGVSYQHVAIRGDAATELLAYAQKHAPGLIVMGTHGRTGLSHVLLGSVAEKVVRHAHCPVLVVPSRAA